MFKMQVKNALKVGNNISVCGPCENIREYKGRLKDDFGNVYETYRPIGKDLVIDDNFIDVCFKGDMDKNSLKGLVLQGV